MHDLILGKYEIIRRLAVGGMGEIFLARQRAGGFDRLVILKSLLPDLADQEDFIEQFLDEARAAATLNHPNIVSMYEVGEWEDIYYIAMEFIKGESISGLLTGAHKRGRSLPFPVTARIIHDAAIGLDHAHHATDPDGQPLAIVHRDVTPQNIMVRTDGVTKVVDFGVARAANRATRTATGLLKGKISYMPPEQLGGQELDGRTDEWGLGVVLWESLTGRRLFRGKNDIAILRQILDAPTPPPSSIVNDLPPQLDAVVMRMLDRDRDKRFGRLRDVGDALRGYLDTVSQQSSETKVAELVQEIAGNRIQENLADLTPTYTSRPSRVRRESQEKSAPAPRARSRGLFLIAFLVTATIGVAVGVWRWQSALALLALPPLPIEASATAAPATAAESPSTQEEETILALTSEPRGAKVYAGMRLLGQTPVRLRTLAPDTDYQLVIDKAGFESSIVMVRLEKGKTKELAVTLKRRTSRANTGRRSHAGSRRGPAAPSAALEADGFLTVRTTPWTRVLIDGKPYGSTPLFRVKLSAGSHKIQLINENEGVNDKRTIRVDPGVVTKVDVKLTKE